MGILIAGSMGEAHHLDPEERVALIKAARQVLDDNDLETHPIICGTGVGSARQTIAITKLSAEAGADYAIVITSGYFAGLLDYPAIKAFFLEVAEASPIPVMIYNCKWPIREPFLSDSMASELFAHLCRPRCFWWS